MYFQVIVHDKRGSSKVNHYNMERSDPWPIKDLLRVILLLIIIIIIVFVVVIIVVVMHCHCHCYCYCYCCIVIVQLLNKY